MANILTRRNDALIAVAALNLAVAKLSSAIPGDDDSVLAETMDGFESTALDLAAALQELLLYLRGVQTLNQQVSEITGVDLSPMAIERDQRLRTLYEEIVKTRGTDLEPAARQIFKAFVAREYSK